MNRTAAEKQFAVWLTTQTNAQGRPYKAYVANRYAACLRTEPLKLDIPLSAEERDTYRCRTLQDFEWLNQIFRTAPNFQEVDRGSGHGTFSAGLSAYRRYVHYLENGCVETLVASTALTTSHKVYAPPKIRDRGIQRVDFSQPNACSGCDPVSCVVEGNTFFVRNWRDILTELTEYCLETKPKAQELFHCSLYSRGNRPFLLEDRPNIGQDARQISTGHWIYLNLSISNLVSTIGQLCEFCDVSFDDVDIWYAPKSSSSRSTNIPELQQDSSGGQIDIVPTKLLDALRNTYSNGFRFEATSITLLANTSGIQIDEGLKAKLESSMFGRKDGVFFLPDQIADEEAQADLLATTGAYLRAYGCFETSEVYQQFEKRLNPVCIKTAEDFEGYYLWIAQRDVRCVTAPQIGNRIVRYSGGNVWATFGEVAKKIVPFINERYYGSCTEEELHREFSAFSKDLLSKIVRHCASDELVRVEINDTICYQSFSALGLPENFSGILSTTLERLEEIGLSPSQETLHTALSLGLGVNFKSEFSLPDWDTYRRLIKAYYKGQPHREWKNNSFVEVDG